MGNKAWVLQLNVANFTPFIPGSSIDRVPTGPYMAEIVDSEQVPKKDGNGPDNVVFDFRVVEPKQFAGKKLRIYLPVDPAVGDGMIGRKWHNLLVACAKKPEQVDAGGHTLKGDYFKGKVVPLYVQEVPGKDEKNRDLLPNVDPIEPATYAKFKAEGGPGQEAKAGATATGSQTPAMQVTGGAQNGSASATPSAPAAVTLE